MWSEKRIISGLTVFLFLFSSAVFSEDTSNSTDTTTQPQVQTTPTFPSRFNPRTPILTQKVIKKILDVDIQKNLLEAKIPDKLSKLGKHTKIVTNVSFLLLMIEYDRLIKNPELPEVTRIQLKWYKAYGENLAKFKPVISKIEAAIDGKSSNNYFFAIKEFKRLQEDCLAFLKLPAPKISKEQYAALRKANTLKRAQDYEKYKRERKAAELREKQEKRTKTRKKTSRK